MLLMLLSIDLYNHLLTIDKAASMAGLRQRAQVEITPDPSQPSMHTFSVQQQRQRQQLQQHREIATLASFIMFLWCGSIVLGCQLFDGTKPKYHSPVLATYDLLFRSAGALLPFAILIPRALGMFLLEGRAFPQHAMHKNIMYIYMALTVLRAVVYNVVLVVTGGAKDEGRQGQVVKSFRHQFMSDHVFLASCVVGILLSEAGILLRIVRSSAKEGTRVCAAILLAGALAILLLTNCEAFVTARYYHPPREIMVAALGGFVLFQLPLGVWTVRLLPSTPVV